ncbi:hypothetical protein PG997_000196 [Apiospora hydei]|uniref:Uncharacterized protein n=1 Tax=Apiospora hydei TaxID=1337664 RepID=A0ABR1XA39_9PEZI
MVVLKIAEPAGLKLAYRQPPPLLVVPIVPGATSKRAFVRAAVAQAAGAVQAPDHIRKMPRGTGAGGRPLEAVVTSTARHVQIVWSVAAPPPPGEFRNRPQCHHLGAPLCCPLPSPEGHPPSTSFQAVTSLADLTDAEFHDCVRKLQSREEANTSRRAAQEDYFVLEVQYGYEEQKKPHLLPQLTSLEEEEEEFLPLPPIAMSTTRADFSPVSEKKRPALPAQGYQHSKQYEEDLRNLTMLASASSSGLMGPPPPASGGRRSGSLPRSRGQYLPTLQEEPEDVEDVENVEYVAGGPEHIPRASEQKVVGRTGVDPARMGGDGREPLTDEQLIGKRINLPAEAYKKFAFPKTPAGSPRRGRQRRQQQDPVADFVLDPKEKTKDGRPETYTPEVWVINKTILDDRIAANEQQEKLPGRDGNGAVERHQSPTRAGNKSRIPVLPSLGFNIKKTASSSSLSEDSKKRESTSASSSSSQQKDHPHPEE